MDILADAQHRDPKEMCSQKETVARIELWLDQLRVLHKQTMHKYTVRCPMVPVYPLLYGVHSTTHSALSQETGGGRSLLNHGYAARVRRCWNGETLLCKERLQSLDLRQLTLPAFQP